MKQVSVLFCDIVNSTPMSERLGPEAMRDLVSAFLETSLAEVRRYGGMAGRYMDRSRVPMTTSFPARSFWERCARRWQPSRCSLWRLRWMRHKIRNEGRVCAQWRGS